MKEYVMRYENEVLQLLPDKMQELVRCRNCKFHDAGENECDAWNRCRLHSINTNDDEFCSWGVKLND